MTAPIPDGTDNRSSLFFSTSEESLRNVVLSWPWPEVAPPATRELLARSRKLFVGGHASYENFTSAVSLGLQAVECLIASMIPDVKGQTFGRMLRHPKMEGLLTEAQAEWCREFALPFRNRLAHNASSTLLTPGMSEAMLDAIHAMCAEISGRDQAKDLGQE